MWNFVCSLNTRGGERREEGVAGNKREGRREEGEVNDSGFYSELF